MSLYALFSHFHLLRDTITFCLRSQSRHLPFCPFCRATRIPFCLYYFVYILKCVVAYLYSYRNILFIYLSIKERTFGILILHIVRFLHTWLQGVQVEHPYPKSTLSIICVYFVFLYTCVMLVCILTFSAFRQGISRICAPFMHACLRSMFASILLCRLSLFSSIIKGTCQNITYYIV